MLARSLPLAGRRITIVDSRETNHDSFVAPLRFAGADVTSTVELNDLTNGNLTSRCDVLLLVSDRSEPASMRATRNLRQDDFRGVILSLVGDWSPEVASEWTSSGLADDCLPMFTDTRELIGPVVDYLVRARNATSQNLSSFEPRRPLSADGRRLAARNV